jgi:1-phosphofructokinase family hexose kinase
MPSRDIVFFSLHPTRDVALNLERADLGQVLRARSWFQYPGGKGLNAARTAGMLEGRVRAVTMAPPSWRAEVRNFLSRHGVRNRFIPVEGDGRTCVVINEGTRETVINTDLKMQFTVRHYRLIAREVWRAARRARFIVFAGSLPPALGMRRFKELMRIASSASAGLVLDQSGKWLAVGCGFRPWAIKPNLREFSMLVGRRPDTRRKMVSAARNLMANGVGRVLLSLGSSGCLMVSPSGRWYAPPVRAGAVPVSAIGSGDALLGGFLKAVSEGLEEPEALKWGVAAATANLAHTGACLMTPSEIRALVPRVEVKSVG